MVAASAIGTPMISVASSVAATPIVATASAGIAQVRNGAATGAEAAARELCFAPAEVRLREAVAIGTLAGWLLSQRSRGGKRVGGSARQRQLLERTQVTQHDAAVLLADEARVLEAPQHRVHLAETAGREVGERVL